MDPIALLKAEIYSDDIEVVLTALGRLEAIGLALGASRSRKELIPLLIEYCGAREAIEAIAASSSSSGAEAASSPSRTSKNSSGPANQLHTDRVIPDEAMAVLGENLGKLAGPALGVSASSLMPLLEVLAAKDETCVRDAAARGINLIVKHADSTQLVDAVLPIIERMGVHEWFPSRCSTTAIISPLYERVHNEQAEATLRALMTSLCKDDTPMVRRAAFIQLPSLCAVVGAQMLRADLIQSLRALCEDEQDAVRIYIVDCSLAIAKAVDELNCKEIAVPLIEEASADTSWRVRRHLARHMDDLIEAVGEDVAAQSLVPLLVGLLRDTEPEVRTAIVKKLVPCCKSIGVERTTEHVLPALKAIGSDTSDAVRIAFSESIGDLSLLMKPDGARKELLPVVIDMLQDEQFDLRLRILEDIHVLGKVIGMEHLVEAIQPKMEQMSLDQKWRIRAGVLGKISNFTKEAGSSVFDSSYHDLLFRGLSDTVYEVRRICAEQIGSIVENFGADWAQKSLIPDTLKMFDVSSNYLHRIVPLQVISSCAAHFDQSYVAGTLLPVVVSGCKDSIANVRICAARTMEVVIPALEAGVQRDKVRPLLQKMKDDSDLDVKYYAGQALQKIK